MTAQPEPQPSPTRTLWMMAGGEVTLLPVDLESGLQRGVVTHWLTGAAGLVVTIGVRTSREAAAMCSGQRVWVSGREAADEELIVLEVIARRASEQDDTTLILTGVLPLARERRRSAVRAATRHPAMLTYTDGTTAQGVATDLSHGGCRIDLNQPDLAQSVGAMAEVRIELPGNRRFALEAEVVRIDTQTGELGMRFDPTEIDLAPIDRLVYAAVKRQKISEEY
ncbi:MAG TPA: PilZ domain-containing protein [Acidothermaceae bacterium]